MQPEMNGAVDRRVPREPHWGGGRARLEVGAEGQEVPRLGEAAVEVVLSRIVVAQDEISEVQARAETEGETRALGVKAALAREEFRISLRPRARAVDERHAVDASEIQGERPSQAQLLDQREANLEVSDEGVRTEEVTVVHAAVRERAAEAEYLRIAAE